MKNLNLKKVEILGAAFGIILGTMLHFTYQWSGMNKLVGLFSAVNESVWEHTKLFFFPVVIFMAIELWLIKDSNKVLFAKVAEIFFGITFIISFFYTYTGAFGIENVWIDIPYFFVAVVLGKYLSYRILVSKEKFEGIKNLHLAVIALACLFYFVATFSPPRIPLFRDSESGTYGLEK
jgi:hypothetical protein